MLCLSGFWTIFSLGAPDILLLFSIIKFDYSVLLKSNDTLLKLVKVYVFPVSSVLSKQCKAWISSNFLLSCPTIVGFGLLCYKTHQTCIVECNTGLYHVICVLSLPYKVNWVKSENSKHLLGNELRASQSECAKSTPASLEIPYRAEKLLNLADKYYRLLDIHLVTSIEESWRKRLEWWPGCFGPTFHFSYEISNSFGVLLSTL